MKLYTRHGDTGQTSLVGGKRVSKDDIRIAVCGDLDELNAHIGLLLSSACPNENLLCSYAYSNCCFISAANCRIPTTR